MERTNRQFRTRRPGLNKRHKVQTRRVPVSLQGENNAKARLTDAGVHRLWELRKEGLRASGISQLLRQEGHHASPSNVQRILEGRGWNHLRPAWADQ